MLKKGTHMLICRKGDLASLLRIVAVVIAILSITACVPSMQRIYQTPAVNGRVIDLTTMQPIQGALVRHQLSDEKMISKRAGKAAGMSVMTNAAGEFYLPSVSSLEYTLLMVGHARESYPVRVSTKNNSALALAWGSMKMLSEETSAIAVVILDPEPDIIAGTPPGDYLSHQLLLSYLNVQQRFGYCDLNLGADALSLLNTARKLYWRSLNEINFDPKKLKLAYYNTKVLWQIFYHSCDYGDNKNLAYKKALVAVSETAKPIYREIEFLGHNP